MLAFGDRNEIELSLGNDTWMNSSNTYINLLTRELKLGNTRGKQELLPLQSGFQGRNNT